LYQVLYEGPLGARPPEPKALAVCPSKEAAQDLKKQGGLSGVSVVIEEVDVLVHEDRDGFSYHLLADIEGFMPGALKLKRVM
jgi:hypothetical protein